MATGDQTLISIFQVTIVLPQLWSERACGNVSLASVTGNTLYKHADLLISSSRGQRHVTQGATCGEPGHQVTWPVSQLLDVRRRKVLGNLLVSDWSQYRYGVFSEAGEAGDSLYPNYYYHHGHVLPTGPSNTVVTGSWRHVNTSGGCDPTRDTCHYYPEGANTGLTCSLGTWPEVETVTRWCGENITQGPGMQSVLCGGRSTRQVIRDHQDFASYGQLNSVDQTGGQAPIVLPRVKFDVVRVPQPKYVLVIETSARLAGVWQWVRKAIVNLIRSVV